MFCTLIIIILYALDEILKFRESTLSVPVIIIII